VAPALHPPLNAASRPRRRLRHGGRRAAAFGLAALGLLLGGCVYLRLLAFKRQLADFDRHFTLQTDDGLRLGCLTPVLLPEDFRWLGLTPETVKTLGQSVTGGANTAYFWRSGNHRSLETFGCRKQVSHRKKKFKKSFLMKFLRKYSLGRR
jgi:hypothetical protein